MRIPIHTSKKLYASSAKEPLEELGRVTTLVSVNEEEAKAEFVVVDKGDRD